MSGFEINKILASILVAIIIFVIIGFVGNFIVKINQNESLVKAYKIDLPEASTDSAMKKATNNEKFESISSLLASASLEKGEKNFKKVKNSHTISIGQFGKIIIFFDWAFSLSSR